MAKGFKKALIFLLAAVFLISIGLTLRQVISYRQAKAAYDQAQQMAFATEETTRPSTATEATEAPVEATQTPTQPPVPMDAHGEELKKINLRELRYVNQDVLGWIHIPDTAISYPLMYSADAEHYLSHAWDGTDNPAGSIFLEQKNRTDLSDFNTIVYGHNMKNGSMFGDLVGYWKPEFYAEHPGVYLVTDGGIARYDIFAAYEADVQSNTYRLYFADDAQKQACIQEYLSQTELPTGITPDGNQPILTLSTCVGTGQYDTRWVVQAVRTAYWEN